MTAAAKDDDDISPMKKVFGNAWLQLVVGASIISFQVQKLDGRMERLEAGSIALQISTSALSQDVAMFKAKTITRDGEIAEIRRDLSVLSERLAVLETRSPFPRGRQ